MSVILDKDGSNELSVLARGGYYVRIRQGQDSGMAPLKALSDTPEARSWLEEFVKGLIMADGKGEPPADQIERIGTPSSSCCAARRTCARSAACASSSTTATTAPAPVWSGGAGAARSAGRSTATQDLIRLDAGVVGIDNTEILPDDMITVRAPAAAYQFFRIREKVGRGVRAAVYVDEGASYLPDARFAAGFDAFSAASCARATACCGCCPPSAGLARTTRWARRCSPTARPSCCSPTPSPTKRFTATC